MPEVLGAQHLPPRPLGPRRICQRPGHPQRLEHPEDQTMTTPPRNTKAAPKRTNKAAVPVEHAQPGPDGYICQTPGAKFPGEAAASDGRVSSTRQAMDGKASLPGQ